MKIVVAPDSFKGSISSSDACEAIKSGIEKAIPDATVICKPIADGGEGTLDALVSEKRKIFVKVSGPLFSPVRACYGYAGDTAIIEMASAAGLTLLPEFKRNAGRTTTYGVGELVLHALEGGYRKIMLTVGGSATNDGGCGMLAALGATFKNFEGKSFIPTGDTLASVSRIDLSGLASSVLECEFLIATDVKNTLLGKNGATYVYAAQKGASEAQLEALESGMASYAEILKELSGRDVTAIEGCGAGGGISAPLLAFFDARIQSGIDTVLDVIDLDKELEGADAVITGEGRIDAQSLCGKAISGVARRANKASIPVYCFVGCIGDDADKLKSMGIADIYDIASVAYSTEDSMKNADKYLYEMAQGLAKSLSKKE